MNWLGENFRIDVPDLSAEELGLGDLEYRGQRGVPDVDLNLRGEESLPSAPSVLDENGEVKEEYIGKKASININDGYARVRNSLSEVIFGLNKDILVEIDSPDILTIEGKKFVNIAYTNSNGEVNYGYIYHKFLNPRPDLSNI